MEVVGSWPLEERGPRPSASVPRARAVLNGAPRAWRPVLGPGQASRRGSGEQGHRARIAPPCGSVPGLRSGRRRLDPSPGGVRCALSKIRPGPDLGRGQSGSATARGPGPGKGRQEQSPGGRGGGPTGRGFVGRLIMGPHRVVCFAGDLIQDRDRASAAGPVSPADRPLWAGPGRSRPGSAQFGEFSAVFATGKSVMPGPGTVGPLLAVSPECRHRRTGVGGVAAGGGSHRECRRSRPRPGKSRRNRGLRRVARPSWAGVGRPEPRSARGQSTLDQLVEVQILVPQLSSSLTIRP